MTGEFANPPTGWSQAMTQIGDIGVSATQVITPVGTFPLKGTQWIVTDQSRTTTKIPTVAIVLAVVFIWVCFLSLLFLLMKEEVTEGYVQVAVSNPELGLYHVASIRADGNQTYEYVTRQVNWARSIAAAL